MQKKSNVGGGRKALKLKRMGLHERAAARMRAMIIRGELAPGSPTQETKLSSALGVSRTPLREAMKLLAAAIDPVERHRFRRRLTRCRSRRPVPSSG